MLALPFGAAAQGRQRPDRPDRPGRPDAPSNEDFVLERKVSADPNVVVTLCVAEGNVSVRGWERDEVRARSETSGTLRVEAVGAQPARHVGVVVSQEKDAEFVPGRCGSTSGLEINVPRGATVNLTVRDGHVEVSGVADARIEALSGDVDVRDVSKSVEVSCMSGDIALEDSSGRTRLRTVSGNVEARNVRTVGAGEEFDAGSTSGDVTLQGVKHTQVRGATVSGSVLYTGELARGGIYDFKTISGDVTVELPADSSFDLRAKVVVDGEIITDFPVKMNTPQPGQLPRAPQPTTPPQPPQPNPKKHPRHPPQPPEMGQTRLDGTVGSGGAVLNLSSFNGTLHLKKQ